MSTFRIDTQELQDAIAAANRLPFAKLTEALGEGVTNFKDRLRGSGEAPGDVWPIGTVKRSASGRKYYVEPGQGRRSGRSLKAWKSRQSGMSALVFNDARAAKGGKYYARFIHRRDQPAGLGGDGLGAAAEEALEIFEEEMAKAGDEMARLMFEGAA